jgi:hypothetical protein
VLVFPIPPDGKNAVEAGCTEVDVYQWFARRSGPAFFVVAHDDGRNPIEAAMLYLEYKRHGLPADLHVYAKGGHGFGMRRQPGRPVSDWPARVAEWMASLGFAPAEPVRQP